MPKHAHDLEERILEAARLYGSGLTLSQVAKAFTPAISQQMVSKLFRKGVELGILQNLPYRRKRAGTDLTEELVHSAALRFGSLREIAAALDCRIDVIKLKFGPIVVAARKEKRAARRLKKQSATIEEYRELAGKLGRNPTSVEMPSALAQRIMRQFESFEVFWSTSDMQPDYRKPSLKRRADLSKDTKP